MTDEKITARFMSKVDKDGPTVAHVDGLGSCWIWIAYRRRDGYGQMRVGGRMLSAHRVSYELHNGPVPNGLCVLHRCDVPGCVNPTHLFLGTKADNNRDRNAKQRHASGEQHGSARLSAANVLEIRKLYAAGGVFQRELGKRFGVTTMSISHILSRKRWRHVA